MLLYSFKCLLEIVNTQLGKNSCGGTPGPIPNPEVKPVNAESTWREASREDRNLPSSMSASLAQSLEHAAVNAVCQWFKSIRKRQFFIFWENFYKKIIILKSL